MYETILWLRYKIISRSEEFHWVARTLVIRRFLLHSDRPIESTVSQFRLIVNGVVVWQSTNWLAANAQFSPNGGDFRGVYIC